MDLSRAERQIRKRREPDIGAGVEHHVAGPDASLRDQDVYSLLLADDALEVAPLVELPHIQMEGVAAYMDRLAGPHLEEVAPDRTRKPTNRLLPAGAAHEISAGAEPSVVVALGAMDSNIALNPIRYLTTATQSKARQSTAVHAGCQCSAIHGVGRTCL